VGGLEKKDPTQRTREEKSFPLGLRKADTSAKLHTLKAASKLKYFLGLRPFSIILLFDSFKATVRKNF
jgi:hypothetical protein